MTKLSGNEPEFPKQVPVEGHLETGQCQQIVQSGLGKIEGRTLISDHIARIEAAEVILLLAPKNIAIGLEDFVKDTKCVKKIRHELTAIAQMNDVKRLIIEHPIM